MRIDKYLKLSRIIKRRTVANEACSGGRVMINDKTAKPSSEVRVGDVISIRFGEHVGHYKVVKLMEVANKSQSGEMYQIISEDAFLASERGLS